MGSHADKSRIISIMEIKPVDSESAPKTISTTCPYCGVGCGVDINVSKANQSTLELDSAAKNSKLTGLTGTPEHPANFGRLCVKGTNLLETNSLDGRLLHPKVFGKKASWESAIGHIATKFSQTIAEHGPDSVAFYVSGQLLTEDYYVANKLMKGYIGSANIDTNSRLCMSSAVAAYKRAFGADAVPCSYEDLDLTDTLILVGSNAAWTHPVLFQRIELAKKRNPAMRIIVIDPRKTVSCELADQHLAIKPGTDTALFNGLLNHLSQSECLDTQFIEHHTDNFDLALQNAQDWTPEKVASYCQVSLAELTAFYQHFSLSDRVVTAYSMGVNQSSSGVDKANSIINCHLASGQLGKVGSGPFSLTGQPNAMGGREVGGLANMLAAHMDIENPVHQQIVQDFWCSPTIATKQGLKAVDLFEKIDQGEVKAVWIMATNPVVSMPNRQKIKRALEKCELVVVSDCMANNDTLAHADIALPATGWSEKDGTVTNSERRISRQRKLLAPAGEARHDWQIICDVAKAMGFSDGFNYSRPSEVFSEHARLTAYKNNGSRDLDLSGLADLSEKDYMALQPIQWPVNGNNPQGSKRLFEDNRFYTKTGKAKFIPIVARSPESAINSQFPLVLNTGRVRDQWHTMTRTGKAASLNGHSERALLSVHPTDAANYQLTDGDIVAISSFTNHNAKDAEQVNLPVKIDKFQRVGEVFAPIHWSATNSSSSAIANLFADSHDPISGQPELKYTAVALQKLATKQQGVLYINGDLSNEVLNQYFIYWTRIKVDIGHKILFAYDNEFELLAFRQSLSPFEKWYSASLAGGQYQSFALKDKKLACAIFVNTQLPDIESGWLTHLFQGETLSPEQVAGLLRAEADEAFQQGRLVCSCFKLGEKQIVEAIKQGHSSIESLGANLKCGTNCGSCKPELAQLIENNGKPRL
ncbi:molybdopterin-dependent oxidoreductase [Aliiglaciecola sp.]|nr:molybdopterin-dependent oxidoreductase [Aliiglaciecola sp.]